MKATHCLGLVTQAATGVTGYVLLFIHISEPHQKPFHSYSRSKKNAIRISLPNICNN